MVQFASKGIYTLPDAGRLIGEKSATLRRWAFGYERSGRVYPAAIVTELPQMDDARAITFLELVELMSIRALRRAGVPWRLVREAAGLAREMFDTQHPFALRKWFVDPAGIYTRLQDQEGETVFVEVSGGGQTAMEHMLQQYLLQLDFDVDDMAERWHPLGKNRPIVVDPRRAFGAPTITGTRITTAAVAEMCNDQTSVEEIAWWYDIDAWKVEVAVEFERRRSES